MHFTVFWDGKNGHAYSKKLAIELDDRQHALEENKEYDMIRSEYLKSQVIELIRFWNNDVIQNIDGVIQRIAERVTPPGLLLK